MFLNTKSGSIEKISSSDSFFVRMTRKAISLWQKIRGFNLRLLYFDRLSTGFAALLAITSSKQR